MAIVCYLLLFVNSLLNSSELHFAIAFLIFALYFVFKIVLKISFKFESALLGVVAAFTFLFSIQTCGLVVVIIALKSLTNIVKQQNESV